MKWLLSILLALPLAAGAQVYVGAAAGNLDPQEHIDGNRLQASIGYTFRTKTSIELSAATADAALNRQTAIGLHLQQDLLDLAGAALVGRIGAYQVDGTFTSKQSSGAVINTEFSQVTPSIGVGLELGRGIGLEQTKLRVLYEILQRRGEFEGARQITFGVLRSF